jgi:N utilization substance protein A
VAAALAPAIAVSVTPIEDNDRAFRVVVNDEQLSLAIGREGQNARLAAKLTNCKIDIKSKKSMAEMSETEVDNA